MINTDELRKNNPLSTKEWDSYLSNLLKGTLEGTLEGEELTDLSNGVLTYNPRALYDFFDEKEILVEVAYMSFEYKNKWFYIVNDKDPDEGTNDEYTAPNRKQAEEDGFIKAFKLLEEKLKANG